MAIVGWLVLVALAVVLTVTTFGSLMFAGPRSGETVWLGCCCVGVWAGVLQLAPFTLMFT